MIDWPRLKEAIHAARRHIRDGELAQALYAIDIVEDCVTPLQERERVERFDAEFENRR